MAAMAKYSNYPMCDDGDVLLHVSPEMAMKLHGDELKEHCKNRSFKVLVDSFNEDRVTRGNITVPVWNLHVRDKKSGTELELSQYTPQHGTLISRLMLHCLLPQRKWRFNSFSQTVLPSSRQL